MTQSTHGLVQSQVLGAAAVALSKERARHRKLVADIEMADYDARDNAAISVSLVKVRDAEVQYETAYRRYTNPFNVEKTVDARWPNVPK